MPVFTDGFDPTTPGSLDAAGTDLTWTEVLGGYQADFGRFVHGDGNAADWARAEHDASTADQFVEVTVLTHPNGGGNVGIVLQYSASANSGYVFIAKQQTTSTYRIFKVTAGVLAQLGATINDAAGVPDGTVLRFEKQGTTLTSYVNGVESDSVVDTTFSANRRGGLYSAAALAGDMDNFSFGDLSSGVGHVVGVIGTGNF